MSLITKKQLSMALQTMRQLLSFKADKSALATKIDRSEIANPIELVAETGLVSPVAADDGSIYTDENNIIYTL